MKYQSLFFLLALAASACTPKPPTWLKAVDPVPVEAPAMATTTPTPLGEWLKGRWTILAFGFTSCPDICPNTMGLAKQVISKLEPNVQIGLVTVDPSHDSLERLREYLKFFHKDLVGIRGDEGQTQALAKALATTYGTMPDTGQLFHSIKFYLIDPSGRWVAYFNQDEMQKPDFSKELLSYVNTPRKTL